MHLRRNLPTQPFKVILIGNAASGKTTLLSRLKKEAPHIGYQNTIGVTFSTLTYQNQDQNPLELSFMDTPGITLCPSFVRSQYKDTNLVIFTLDSSQDIKEQQEYLTQEANMVFEKCPSAIPILVITKSDLPAAPDLDIKNIKDIENIRGNLGAKQHIISSAKANTGIQEIENLILNHASMLASKQNKSMEKSNHDNEHVTQLIQNLQALQRKATADLKANRLTLAQYTMLIKDTNTLTEKIADKKITFQDINTFKQNTRYLTTCSLWKKIVGGIVGAIVGIIVGAMIGLASGPGAAITALAGGIQGAMIGASIGGTAGMGASTAGFHFWKKHHPISQIIDSATKLCQSQPSIKPSL